eukprot:Partr_v1_DN26281_c0_g1_i11_m48150 putative Cytochrome b5 reductase 4
MADNPPPPTFPLAGSAQRVSTGLTVPGSGGAHRPRAKVILEPGHSPLDWANKKKSTSQDKLTGVTQLSHYSLQDILAHKKEDDLWLALRGKVYNVTTYIPFHPGGKKMLMSVAGKDATALFDKYHHWVNAEFLLDKCLVGFLRT